MKQVGEMTPDLLGLDQNGNEVRRSQFPGSKIVLYFYPKDNTPGCSLEAKNLTENADALAEAGYQVIGVSVDSQASHCKFIAKYGIPFPLIADTDHSLVEEFGVWGEKTLAGRKYMGTFRTTFLIDPDGTITRVIGPKEIKPAIHASQILNP